MAGSSAPRREEGWVIPFSTSSTIPPTSLPPPAQKDFKEKHNTSSGLWSLLHYILHQAPSRGIFIKASHLVNQSSKPLQRRQTQVHNLPSPLIKVPKHHLPVETEQSLFLFLFLIPLFLISNAFFHFSVSYFLFFIL